MNFVMEQSVGRYVTNINTNSNLREKKIILGKMDETDEISKIRPSKGDRNDVLKT